MCVLRNLSTEPLSSAFHSFSIVLHDNQQGKQLPGWLVNTDYLGTEHIVSVARGPAADVIVDKNGEFKGTFEDPSLDRAVDAPPFSLLTIADLLPEDFLDEYELLF